MNITFFIGNGFDINIGLKTRYSNFYPYFIEKSSDNNMIKEWIVDSESQWSDLEKKLGEELKRVSDADLEKFFDDKEELDLLLAQYLEQEERKADDSTIASLNEEFIRSIKEFEDGAPETAQIEIGNIRKSHINERYVYQFVSIYYTRILDRMTDLAKKNASSLKHFRSNGGIIQDAIGSVVHVHGTTEAEMVLGVNDSGQIGSEKLRLNPDLQQSIVKSKMNERSRNNKTSKVRKMIQDSCIIAVYGMSLGETDNMWWDTLIDWLTNPSNRLIIFVHCKDYKDITRSATKKNRITTRYIKSFLRRKKLSSDEFDKLESRIIIVLSPTVFRFDG